METPYTSLMPGQQRYGGIINVGKQCLRELCDSVKKKNRVNRKDELYKIDSAVLNIN